MNWITKGHWTPIWNACTFFPRFQRGISMSYVLAIGDRTYSSWSLRAWLLFEAFDVPVTVRLAHMRTPEFADVLAGFGAARTVPAVQFEHGALWDSMAILETLAERHPEAGYWPTGGPARAVARNLVAEMHAGFADLRRDCPMMLRSAFVGFEPGDGVEADVHRICQIWTIARGHQTDGPWLFGSYTAADAYFAPVAARIAAYGLQVPAKDRAYVDAHLHHPSFRRWRAMALADPHVQTQYEIDLKPQPWPGPPAIPAAAVSEGVPVNPHCPFSGKPVAADALARIDGKIVGFCNTFCREKSVADPAAWPEVMALIARNGA